MDACGRVPGPCSCRAGLPLSRPGLRGARTRRHTSDDIGIYGIGNAGVLHRRLRDNVGRGTNGNLGGRPLLWEQGDRHLIAARSSGLFGGQRLFLTGHYYDVMVLCAVLFRGVPWTRRRPFPRGDGRTMADRSFRGLRAVYVDVLYRCSALGLGGGWLLSARRGASAWAYRLRDSRDRGRAHGWWGCAPGRRLVLGARIGKFNRGTASNTPSRPPYPMLCWERCPGVWRSASTGSTLGGQARGIQDRYRCL